MRTAETAWAEELVSAQDTRRDRVTDFLAVAVLCVIFGLQIVAVMRTPGGPQAYQAIATEGMQQQ